MTFKHLTKEVVVEVLAKRSINGKEVSKIKVKKGENWMTLIYEYLLGGLLPEDPREARKIGIRAPQYKLIKGRLYKKTLPRNSQNETPFNLTYGLEAIIPSAISLIPKSKERTKKLRGKKARKESTLDRLHIRDCSGQKAMVNDNVWFAFQDEAGDEMKESSKPKETKLFNLVP
ncbi:hypothetical protein Tco_1309462 [Tanacetum coccineum]